MVHSTFSQFIKIDILITLFPLPQIDYTMCMSCIQRPYVDAAVNAKLPISWSEKVIPLLQLV
jgi:hypothetical protein